MNLEFRAQKPLEGAGAFDESRRTVGVTRSAYREYAERPACKGDCPRNGAQGPAAWYKQGEPL